MKEKIRAENQDRSETTPVVAGNLEHKAEQLFGEEWRKEGLPEIKLKIFYSAHDTADDLVGFQDKFERTDIYFPEGDGWSEGLLDVYWSVVSGQAKPEEALKEVSLDSGSEHEIGAEESGFLRELFRIIYNSR